MKIKNGFHLYILINFFYLYDSLWAQSLSVSVTLPVEFGVLPPAIPGDPPVSTYENTLGDARMEVDGGNKWGYGNTWGVTVNKTYLIGGDSYVTIPNSPASILFFSCNTQRRARYLALQHRVLINGGDPPAGTYTTTITYTLVDL